MRAFPPAELTRGVAALVTVVCAAVLLSGCTDSTVDPSEPAAGETTHACPDSARAYYEVSRARESQPLVSDLSDLALPMPVCSFTWSPGGSQWITEDLWMLEDASGVSDLLDEVTGALVASEWELYMEQSATQRMFVPVGDESLTTRLTVMALDATGLANRSLPADTNAIAATLIEEPTPGG